MLEHGQFISAYMPKTCFLSEKLLIVNSSSPGVGLDAYSRFHAAILSGLALRYTS